MCVRASCVCACVRMCVCECECVPVHACVCAGMCLRACMCVYVSVRQCICKIAFHGDTSHNSCETCKTMLTASFPKKITDQIARKAEKKRLSVAGHQRVGYDLSAKTPFSTNRQFFCGKNAFLGPTDSYSTAKSPFSMRQVFYRKTIKTKKRLSVCFLCIFAKALKLCRFGIFFFFFFIFFGAQ